MGLDGAVWNFLLFVFCLLSFVFCFLFCISGEEGNGKIKEDFIDDFMGRGILGFGI